MRDSSRQRKERILFERIVVGTDGFGPSIATVSRAVEIAEDAGAELVVAHVYAPYRQAGPGLGRPEAPPIDARVRVLQSVEKRFGERVQLRTMLKEGDPAEALIDVAEEVDADLLVVGNVGMSKRFTLGAIPNQISHHAPCNVLIVHSSGEQE